MINDDIFKSQPYSFTKDKKQAFLLSHLQDLTDHHKKKSHAYANVLNVMHPNLDISSCDDIPYLPVRLFKEYALKSIEEKDIVKTLTSSGTTSQQVSRIFLDKLTAGYLTKTLVTIMQSFLGNKRCPMIIIDSRNVFKDRQSFSARGAGIMGMSNLGHGHFYLLDDKMEIDEDGLATFLEKHSGQQILIFGFTFMIWKHFVMEAQKKNLKADLSNAVMIHSGGWKKLQELAVDNDTFKSTLNDRFGLKRVHNFYGMVEQVGSIFVECEKGQLHTPLFSDIIIRDPKTWNSLPFNEEGIVEVLSILPHSYPGHALLTEDKGIIHGEDDCPCGRKGKYFSITGRLAKAELRGCSDTYAYDQN